MIAGPLRQLLQATGLPALPPPALRTLVPELEASAWPTIADRWSLLAPGGFPVERTLDGAPASCRWSAEIAPPEFDDRARLHRVAAWLADWGQPLPAPRLRALTALQRARALAFGAWLGAREAPGLPPRFKLYAEWPDAAPAEALDAAVAAGLLPPAAAVLHAALPAGSRLRLLGLEPGAGTERRGRVEAYWRLPGGALERLAPLFAVAGHPRALAGLERDLPDGHRRLAGRRLGLSAAWSDPDPAGPPELAVFVSARSLFPGDALALARWLPLALPTLRGPVRAGLVSLALRADGGPLRAALGVTAPVGAPGLRTAGS